MIWSRIPSAESFRLQYENFNLALGGAVEQSVERLKQRNSRLSIFIGNAAIGTAMIGQSQLITTARLAVAEAASAGSADAGGTTPVDVQIRNANHIEDMVKHLTNADRLKAAAVVHNQALTYDIAYRRMGHEAALAKALGELGSSQFTQLDRIGRRFKSAELATGFVRLAAANAYLDVFLTIAGWKNIANVILVKDGEQRVMDVADLAQNRAELFHPNTVWELRLP